MPQSALGPQEFSGGNEQRRRVVSTKVRSAEHVYQVKQAPQKAIKVLIVDRNSMSSDLLASALSNDPHFVGTTIRPFELLRALGTTEVDLVVIAVDLKLSPGNSFDLVNAVCLAHPKIYVIVIVHQMTQALLINAFWTGARGVFSLQGDMSEFLECIKHVAKGFIWAGKSETSALLGVLKSIPVPNPLISSDSAILSARELQVVQCAAKGETNRAIAVELRLSEHTVKGCLFRAFEKLGISNRVELIFYLTIPGA